MFRFKFFAMAVVVVACLAIGTTSALAEAPQPGQKPTPIQAGPWNTPQPLVGYMATTTCVVPDQPVDVMIHVKNHSKKTLPVVVQPYGVSDLNDTLQKGPSYIVDTTQSGLIQTERLPAWHWFTSLKPGASKDLHMFIVRAPIPYYPPPPWRLKYAPRMYISAVANVRYTDVEINLDTKPTFCQQK